MFGNLFDYMKINHTVKLRVKMKKLIMLLLSSLTQIPPFGNFFRTKSHCYISRVHEEGTAIERYAIY